MIRLVSALFLSIFSSGALALESAETFSSRSHLESGTAVWNQTLGKIHPTLRVMNFKPGFTPLDLSVGDGSDGSFDPSTYAQFSQAGDLSGNIIRLDTTVHPVLHLTRFELAQGWFLEPVGTAPLIIESLTDVDIQGEIWCNGHDGGASIGPTPGAGGLGRCGGKAGGDGAAPGLGGANGVGVTGAVTGGVGGNFVGASYVGGGGGGSWRAANPPTNGPGATGAGGFAGLFSGDPEFLNVLGSGGGGGGSGSGDGVTAGAGGGAGGGVVVIRAVGNVNIGASPVSAFGFIYVGGGRGGDADNQAGPGGGGGGGSVQIFSGGTVNVYNNDPGGASVASAGLGGSNAVFVVGAVGGEGRSWFSAVTYNLVGFYTPSEEAPVVRGNIEYTSAAQYVITKMVDVVYSLVEVQDVAFSPASSDFSFEISGSNDGFVSDDTGWTTNMALVAHKRYLKMKLNVATTNVNAPTMIDTATLNYEPSNLDSFKFQAAGCGRIADPQTPMGNLFLFLFAPLCLLILRFRVNLLKRSLK